MNNYAWEQFYKFIKYMHGYRVRLGDEGLREILIETGVRSEIAEELSAAYLHCRNVLYKKRKYELENMYSWLNSKKAREQLRKEYLEELKHV